MLTLEEAQQRILQDLTPLDSESVPLLEACGRIAARDIRARVDLPTFDNSAMDGYAVRAEDVMHASPTQPARLQVIGRIAAGDSGHLESRPDGIQKGECARIYTGAPIPRGCDAVVMQEDTATLEHPAGVIEVRDAIKPWENIRFRGEDIKKESILVTAGEEVRGAQLGILAATGHGTMEVMGAPRVTLLASGTELREPGGELPPGCLYESNRTVLAAAAKRSGAKVQLAAIVQDSLEVTVEAMRRACEQSDVLITTGGVSVGDLDFLRAAFEKLGGTTEFWKVSVKPGKPFTYGRWKKTWWFGLPGNPVSAFVTYLLLVHPALKAMQGARALFLPRRRGRLMEPLVNRGDRRHWMRVHINGLGEIQITGPQASHRLHSLALANALVDVPPETTLPAGSEVDAWVWDHAHF